MTSRTTTCVPRLAKDRTLKVYLQKAAYLTNEVFTYCMTIFLCIRPAAVPEIRIFMDPPVERPDADTDKDTGKFL